MAGEKKRFLLRLDDRIYQALERWAADELRSVNSQIEYALIQALRQAGRKPEHEPPDSAPQPTTEDPSQGS